MSGMHYRTGVAAMTVMTLLAVSSLVGAAALFIALCSFLDRICVSLEATGGRRKGLYGVPSSYLSQIRVGLRAIEVETGHLAPEVIKLNGGLTAIRDGLGAIDSNLDGVITAVSAQGAT